MQPQDPIDNTQLTSPPTTPNPNALQRLVRKFGVVPFLAATFLLVVLGATAAVYTASSSGKSQKESEQNTQEKAAASQLTEPKQDESEALDQTASQDTQTTPAPTEQPLAASPAAQPQAKPQPSPAPTPPPAASTPTPPPAPKTKNFTINSFSYGFSPSSITASPGDTVVITLTNSGGKHDLVIDGLGVATSSINSGQTTSTSFVVPQSAAGKSFEFYCSVGNHKQQGMVGTLTITN